MKFYIYQILDHNNIPIYIGKTNNIKRRILEHKWSINSNQKRYFNLYLYKKLRKLVKLYNYKFNYSIIDILNSENEANFKEQQQIEFLKNNNTYLCNLTSGGDGTIGHTPVFTEEWRHKLSESARKRQLNNPSFKGKHHSEKSKRLISEINKYNRIGKDNPFYGRFHTQEFKNKLSKERLGIGLKTFKLISPQNNIYIVTEGLNEFCRNINKSLQEKLTPTGLSSVANKRYKTHKGWRAYIIESQQDI